jgi:hypothetical protein
MHLNHMSSCCVSSTWLIGTVSITTEAFLSVATIFYFAEDTFTKNCSGWIWFMFPGFLLGCALFMLCHKYYGNGHLIGAFEVTPPTRRRTVEQLLALQEAISQLEAQVQAGNISLLKLRSLMLAAFPQVCMHPSLALFCMDLATRIREKYLLGFRAPTKSRLFWSSLPRHSHSCRSEPLFYWFCWKRTRGRCQGGRRAARN